MRSAGRPSAAPERRAFSGVDDKRAGDQLVMIVHPRGEPMHRADEGAFAAADHAEANLAALARIAASLDSHCRLP